MNPLNRVAGYVVIVGLVTLGCTLLLPETAPRASGVRLSGQPAPVIILSKKGDRHA